MRRYFYNVRVSSAALETMRGAAVKAHDVKLFTRDQGLLCFYLTEYDNLTSAYVAFAVPANAALTLGIKPSIARQGAFLALSENDQWNIAGDWSEADRATGKVCCRVNCNTVQMLAKFTTATAYQDLVGEIQMLEAGETEPTTLVQFDLRVQQDIVQGDEGAPEPADPDYPTAAQVAAGYVAKSHPDANFRVSGVKLQLYNPTTGKYHDLWAAGPDGAAYLALSENGEA